VWNFNTPFDTHSQYCKECRDKKTCDYQKESQKEIGPSFIGCTTWINCDGEIEAEEIVKDQNAKGELK
jgi:hypothetical protein